MNNDNSSMNTSAKSRYLDLVSNEEDETIPHISYQIVSPSRDGDI